MKAVVMNGRGGRERLEYVERPEPVAGPGQALVSIALAGVNFMDIGVRQGVAWTETPNPKVIGVEGAGRVLAVGEGVDHLPIGVAVFGTVGADASGGYAEFAIASVSIDDRKLLAYRLTSRNDPAASRDGNASRFVEVFTIFNVVCGCNRREKSGQQRCRQDKSARSPRSMGGTARKRHGRALRLKSACDTLHSL